MQAVNSQSSIDTSCSLCLGPTIPRPVGEIFVRGCCKQLVHASCWKRWEDQPGSSVSFQEHTSDRRLTFRRCSLCQQNAVPLIHLSTVAYKNSSLSYCRDGEIKTLLRQLVSDPLASGATDDTQVTEGARTAASPSSEKIVHALLREDMHIPTLAELVEGELNSTDSRIDSSIPPRYRPNKPVVRSACVEHFLLQASQTGDPELIRAILNTDPTLARQSIHSVSHNRSLPMVFVAADNGHVEAVSILGQESPRTFYSSVEFSLDDGNIRALRTLVSAAQADSDSPVLFRQLLRKVQSAASTDNQVSLAQLFRAGTKVDKIVSHAIESHNPLIPSVMYEAGIRKDEILFQVARQNASELLTQLMSTDADSDASDSALAATVLAASKNDLTALMVLVSCGVQLKDALLHAARHNADKPTLTTLVNNGADAHLALSEAVDLNDDRLITNLLSSLDIDPVVFLRHAAERGDLRTINNLLEAGVNPHAGCEDGNPLTPLFIAAGNGHKEIVRAIFTFTGDPGYRPTMIYHAALEADDQTLRCLIKACSNEEQKFSDIACVLQKAIDDKDNGRFALERLMQIKPGRVGGVLMKLVSDGDAQTLASLLKLGANANFSYVTGWSLLHAAASKGEPELVQLLLDHGAALRQLTDTGASALSIAADLGNKPVVSALVKASGSPDINSAISTALEQHDHDTLSHLITVADTDGPTFRQLLMCAARCGNVDAIKTMVQSSRNTVGAEIAFLQAFFDGDPKLTQSFLDAGVGLAGPSSTSYLLMAAVKGNAGMVAAITRHWTNIVGDMYQAATAREVEAFTTLVRAFNDCNPEKNSDELISELIDKAINDKNQCVFDALISAEQQTGMINIGKYLVSALQIRSDALNELNVAQQRMAEAVNDRTQHDQELAMNFDGEGDDDFVDDTRQSSDIESRIAEHASTIKTCQITIRGIEWAIEASVNSGAQRVITVDSAQIILTLAVSTCCPALVKMVLDSWSDPELTTDETRNVVSGALLQAIESQKWDIVKLLTGTTPINCAILNAKRTVLYEAAQSQDTELLGALWRLGVHAAPSVNCALTDDTRQCLQHFINAGITLDDNDNDVDLHPLSAAAQISQDQGNFDKVRSVLSITKNVGTVLYKHALLGHKDVIATIWHCSGKQHQLIMSVVRKAVTTADSTNNSRQVVNTLQQIQGIAPQLSQCLFEAARDGERDVAIALIACNIDIHDPTHNPAFFLYLSARTELMLAAAIMNAWKNKANRNTPILIRQACDMAKRELKEGSQVVCKFLNDWLLSEVHQSSERAAAYVEHQKQQSQNL